MKNIILSAIAFTSLTAFGGEVTKDMNDLARILMNNPSISDKLTSRCLDRLTGFSSKSLENGLDEYTLQFGINGFCEPVKGTVIVTEDLRPTYSDGPAEYNVKEIKIERE